MTGIPFLRCFLFVSLEEKKKFLNSKVSTGIAWSQRSQTEGHQHSSNRKITSFLKKETKGQMSTFRKDKTLKQFPNKVWKAQA